MNAGAAAIPLELVWTLAVADPPNVPLAPLEGGVNVTVTPLTGPPLEFVIVACRSVPNAMLTTVLCGVPPVAVRVVTPIKLTALIVTLPVPDVITHVTVKVFPAEAAR